MSESVSVCTQVTDFKYFDLTLKIQFNIGHLFAHSYMISSTSIKHWKLNLISVKWFLVWLISTNN